MKHPLSQFALVVLLLSGLAFGDVVDSTAGSDSSSSDTPGGATGYYGYTEYRNLEKRNAFLDAVGSTEGNSFMDGYEPSPDAPPTENAFSGEQETLDSADTYTDDLNRRAEDAEESNAFIGVGEGDDPSSSDFSEEYNRLSSMFWKAKPSP